MLCLFLECLKLDVEPSRLTNFSSKEFFKNLNVVINFSALVKATLGFSIKTVNFRAAGPITPPDCYKFNVQVRIKDVGDEFRELGYLAQLIISSAEVSETIGWDLDFYKSCWGLGEENSPSG